MDLFNVMSGIREIRSYNKHINRNESNYPSSIDKKIEKDDIY